MGQPTFKGGFLGLGRSPHKFGDPTKLRGQESRPLGVLSFIENQEHSESGGPRDGDGKNPPMSDSPRKRRPRRPRTPSETSGQATGRGRSREQSSTGEEPLSHREKRRAERRADRDKRGSAPRDPRGSSRRGRKNRGPEAAVVRQVHRDEMDPRALDRDARRVVSRLQQHGFEAYFVGGCVRDLMIGRRPKDFDVATDATPQEIRRLFRNGRIIGRRFRLVHVHYGGNIIETSTFRCEPPEQKGGDDLLIVEDNEFGSAGEDALRRDFTVNALFLNPSTFEIHDWVSGLEDLDARLLRTIGDPMVRLAEDPVRILRAVKFATRLDFEIEDKTWEAMVNLADHLGRSAPPRVLEEILRLLRSGSALGAMKMLRAAGGLRVIFPELDERLGERNADDHEVQQRAAFFWRLLEALDQRVHSGLEPSNPLLLAVLFTPLIEDSFHRDQDHLDRLRLADDCLAPTAERARLAKRETARAARILANHPLFVVQPEEYFSPLLFTLTSEFEESHAYFGLRVQARGKGWDVYEAWDERRERAQEADEEELDEERRRVRGRKRRRRRRATGRGRSSN